MEATVKGTAAGPANRAEVEVAAAATRTAETGRRAGGSGSRNRLPFRLPAWEPLLLFAAILGGWHLATTATALSANPLYPSPAKTALALRDAWPELWKGTVSSFRILAPGYFAAVLSGIAAGLAVGRSERLRRTFFPFARVVAPVPPTVYDPYAIAILPTFLLSAMFVIFVGAFWPVFINTTAGVQAIDPRHRDNARVLGLSRIEYLAFVALPASLPHIFSGMAVGLALSFILLTVAELFGANAGLGRFVQYYADFADYPKMAAGIVYTGGVTWGSMALLERARRRALFWIEREERK